MEQMRPGMVPCRSPAGALVDVRLDYVTRRHLALDPSDMHDRRPHPLGVVDAHSSAWTDELATIADLAATLGVEGRALQDDQRRLLTGAWMTNTRDLDPVCPRLIRVADELARQLR